MPPPSPRIRRSRGQEPTAAHVARTAWVGAIGVLGAAYWALSALHFGPGMSAMTLSFTASGLVFITSAHYIRRRFGGLALVGWCAGAPAVLALAQGGIAAEKMDLVDYSLGAWVMFVLLAPSFVVVGATLHQLARREFRPALLRDVPVAVAVFAIAEVLTFGIVLLLLALTMFRMG